MVELDENGAVLSIFPEEVKARAVEDLFESPTTPWRHARVTGREATEPLRSARRLRGALDSLSPGIASTREYATFSALADRVLHRCGDVQRYLVVSPDVVPLEMARREGGTAWGDSCVFSHILCGEASPDPTQIGGFLSREKHRLGSYLLLCPMRMDRPEPPRHDQDIVMVASELEEWVPVELWLQPDLERARTAFGQRHVTWLHVDTHGTPDGERWMLGPSRGMGEMVGAEALPSSVEPPFVHAVGCALTARATGLGWRLIERGARAVLGPCVSFHSLGMSGSDREEAQWYRVFFQSLLAGRDIGTSLMTARCTTEGGLLKYAWVLLGSSLLRFENEVIQAPPPAERSSD